MASEWRVAEFNNGSREILGFVDGQDAAGDDTNCTKTHGPF